MRSLSQVSKEIKRELANNNIKSSCRSSSDYQVKVIADGSDKAMEIAKRVYHKEKHCWLIVWVDGHCLPMPPININN